MTFTKSPVDAALVRRARLRLLEMHHTAGVGHLGGNLSCLAALLLIFHELLQPQDRFILSKGHSAGALYIALWSAGRLPEQELLGFHKDNTLLAGHPPAQGLQDVLFATGSLGHGLSLAAGTALARRLAGQPGQVICLTSDGEWQEGAMWEALIFACHHRLSNLLVVVDHNGLQGFGSTEEVASMSPLWKRLAGFEAQIEVVDGHDLAALRAAMCIGSSDKPRVVVMRTVKGKGVSFLEGRMDSHYLPLSADRYAAAVSEVTRS